VRLLDKQETEQTRQSLNILIEIIGQKVQDTTGSNTIQEGKMKSEEHVKKYNS